MCTDPLTLTITSKAEPNELPLKNTTVRSQAPDSPTVNSCVVLYGLLILITAPARLRTPTGVIRWLRLVALVERMAHGDLGRSARRTQEVKL